MTSKTTTRFSREVHERAVRIVLEHEAEQGPWDPFWAHGNGLADQREAEALARLAPAADRLRVLKAE